MKTFLATAAIVTALVLPALAEGDDPSTKAGEAKGSVKATTDMKQDVPGNASMGASRATSGSASTSTPATPDKLNKEETSSPANPGQKTGVSGGSGN